jgi:transcriptional regulator with XRE-family HTH domain
MSASENVAELRKLMKEHNLSREEVASLCDVSIHTVNAWLLPQRSKAHRTFRAKELRHLQLELRARTN